MIDIDTNALCGEHRFKSAMQWCFCVFPTTQNNMLHFIQSDSTVSFNFILASRRYSKSFYPPPFALASHSDVARNLLPSTFKPLRGGVVSFSSAAPMPGTSFSQYFLKASLMSSPVTFCALPFEFLLCFHILYLRHMPLEPMGFNTLIAHSKSHPFEDGLCSLSSTLNLSPGALRPFQPFWTSRFITVARHLRLRNLSGESCGPCANLHAKHLCML